MCRGNEILFFKKVPLFAQLNGTTLSQREEQYDFIRTQVYRSSY
jgi:hypothetical protein